jgi:hypothetical protein
VLGINPSDTERPGGPGDAATASSLPASWRGKKIQVHLPRYPWPTGTH